MHAPITTVLGVIVAASVITGCRGTHTGAQDDKPATVDGDPPATLSTLRVHRLDFLSNDGQVLARLGSEGGEAQLQFFAAKRPGVERLRVGLDLFGTPTIVLFDPLGEPDCNLTITNEGEPGTPSITFETKGNAPTNHRFGLSMTPGKAPSLTLTDGNQVREISIEDLFKAAEKQQ